MMNTKSLYECPLCHRTEEAAAGERRGCINCNCLLTETRKGVITKGAPEAPAQAQEPATAAVETKEQPKVVKPAQTPAKAKGKYR